MTKIWSLNVVIEGKSKDPHVRIKSIRMSGIFSTKKPKVNDEYVTEHVQKDILNHYESQQSADIEVTVRITRIERIKNDFMFFDNDEKN